MPHGAMHTYSNFHCPCRLICFSRSLSHLPFKMLRLPIAAVTGIAGASAFAMATSKKDSQLSAASLFSKATASPIAFAPAALGAAPGPFGNPAHQWDYYQKCMIGGILACGLTHAGMNRAM